MSCLIRFFEALQPVNASDEHILQAPVLEVGDHIQRQCKGWFKTYKEHLHMGRIHILIRVLHKRGQGELATYFERHQRQMQHLEFREEGLPIGSGTVESGVKQFKQRLTGTGMCWNTANANHMLIICAAGLGNAFDRLWDAA